MGDKAPNSNQNINGFFLPTSLPLWDVGLHAVCNHGKSVNTEIPKNQPAQEAERADSHFSGDYDTAQHKELPKQVGNPAPPLNSFGSTRNTLGFLPSFFPIYFHSPAGW